MQDALTKAQLEQFIREGFVRINNAFSADTARQARAILWQDLKLDPNDRTTWNQPIIRLGMYSQPPFVEAANTPVLHRAFDQLVGPGQWIPCRSMGTFPVRFPSDTDPGDTGWHVDAGFPGADPGNFWEWRVNVWSKGRGLLMLFLFSDVSEADAPTRIRTGSHQDVARLLQPAGEAGLSFMEVAEKLADLPERPEQLATGNAGTVYLCHPFLVHAAQPHHGTEPRFLAQPPLLIREEFRIEGNEGGYSPVAEAIRQALK
ncbi:phytanoyl-CoA dioxygenase family protein [Larkinella sp. VNQ87]|uniref:phytanoyl-CoA dioxygenase family protein n=1 Tax=Larkinella sp. VNQ87 TaxID=3400921 RepID=UPI003BFB2DAF